LTSGHSDAQAERQNARMSKITNYGLTRSGTECMLYSCTLDNSGRHQRVNTT